MKIFNVKSAIFHLKVGWKFFESKFLNFSLIFERKHEFVNCDNCLVRRGGEHPADRVKFPVCQIGRP